MTGNVAARPACRGVEGLLLDPEVMPVHDPAEIETMTRATTTTSVTERVAAEALRFIQGALMTFSYCLERPLVHLELTR
jgi:hypothetical protein